MTEPKTKVADVVATVRARAIAFARRLSPAQRDRLAGWALAGAAAGAAAPTASGTEGAPADPTVDPAEALVAAAASKDGTRRILAAIEHHARDAFLFFLCGMDVFDEGQFEGQLREFFGWSKSRARAAIDALYVTGLLSRAVAPSYLVEAFPALRLGLGPDLLVWLSGAAEDAAPPMPLPRRLALLVAHAHADPVTLTAQRVLTVRWMERATDVFAAAGFSARLLSACVAFLGRTGALGPDPSDPEAKSWRVEPRAAQTLASAPADLALAFADASEISTWGTALGTLAVLERARLAGDESPTIHRLAELGKAWGEEPRRHYLPFFESQFRPLAVASAVRALREIGLVDVERTEAGVRVRATAPPTTPPASRPFRCTVLPTFEIWVPHDADPVGTADLGRIADLSSTDRVARFTLTQKSVARAAREPGGVAAAIERLAAAAEHGIPDNVRATLEGWGRRATSMRAYSGGVLVAASDEHAAFLRGRTGVLAEIAPGVFHVESDSLADLLRAADRAGHVTTPVVRDGRPGGHRETYVDERPLDERAGEVRAKVAGWAKPAPTTTAASQKARAIPPPDEAEDVPDAFEGVTPLTLRELRQGWPEVAAAVAGYPPIEEFARRLSIYELDDLLDLADAVLVRGRIAQLALERMDAPPPTLGEPPTTPDVAPTMTTTPTTEPATSRPWITPKPGELSRLLAVAALRREMLDIVYVSAAGVRSERRIVPQAVSYSGQREWLNATADGSAIRLELDRVVAVRLLRD